MLASAETASVPTVNGIPIRNVWYMLLYAWGETPRSPYWQMVNEEEAPSLDALLAVVLKRLVEQRLRIGLGCSYMPEQREIRGIRGRVQFSGSIKQHSFPRGRAVCSFEQYSVNAPKNQIIRSTLHQLAQTGAFGPDSRRAERLRHTLRRVVRTLDGIDLIELTPGIIHREQNARHDRDYRIMLAICALILRRQMPSEESGMARISQLERDRLVLHDVFEKFVANFYQHHLAAWSVRSQSQLAWYEAAPNPYLPRMRPDLTLTENATARIVVLDTKFTAHSLVTNQWGKALFSSSHLYQIHTYLATQAHRSPHHKQATGILLYPATDRELSESIRLPDHEIRIECVNLATVWHNIEEQLLAIIPD